MKNKAFITIGLILFFSAALLVKNRSCTTVPTLEGWYEPADEIYIKGKDLTLNMVRKENTWYLNEQAYPGDPELIGSLERKARDFKLLDLVSDNGYYDKYDLTEEKGVSVIVKGKGKLLRKMLIGKAGSTNSHSYMKIGDRKEVYLASGIMKSDFIRPVDDLRNKVIFNVKSQDIKSFSINYGGKNFDFLPNPSLGEKGDKETENKKNESKWICSGSEKVRLNDSSINAILQNFAPLKAAEFPENMEKKNAGNIICKVAILYADKKIELEIYNGKLKDMNYASSTESKYIFTIGSWQTQKLFIKSITDLAVK